VNEGFPVLVGADFDTLKFLIALEDAQI